MALVSKSEPIGIDIPVDRIQRALYTQLVTNGPWQEYESYHRAYQNETENGLRPEVFTSNNDYKEVFMDDTFNVTSFFITDQTRDIQVETEFRSEVSIIFQVQLSKLLTLVPHRADEEFNNQVSNVLRDLGDGIEYLGLEQGISNVFSEFDQEEIQWDDMQPYYVVRFNLSVPYSYDCNTVYLGASCSISLIMSGTNPSPEASDGTATATPVDGQGVLSYLWDDPLGQTTQTATGLPAGTYSCTVTDSIIENCSVTDSFELVPPSLLFRSTKTSSGAFSINYDGVDVPQWIDVTNSITETGTSVTFTTGWDDATEKTVAVYLDNPELVRYPSGFTSQSLTYVDVSNLTGGHTIWSFASNPELSVLLAPQGQAGLMIGFNGNNCALTTVDMSLMSEGAGTINFSFNNLTTFLLPISTRDNTNIYLQNNDLGIIDWSVYENCQDKNNSVTLLQDNNMTTAEGNANVIGIDAIASSGYTGRSLNIGGTNDIITGAGLTAVASLITKGYAVTYNS